jgi:hypothetical protein
MKTSESIKNIAIALKNFQNSVNDPVKSGRANYGKYVTLDALISVARQYLSENGLSFMQIPGGNGQDITITTVLLHESGEWIETEPFTVRVSKHDAQGAGSAVTYLRRYSLSSILGMAWDDDDDGFKASNRDINTGNYYTAKAPAKNPNIEMCKKIAQDAKNASITPEDLTSIVQWKYGRKNSLECTEEELKDLSINYAKYFNSWLDEMSAKEG